MTVEFREVTPGQTAVILTHTGFADGDRRDLHREGWELRIDEPGHGGGRHPLMRRRTS